MRHTGTLKAPTLNLLLRRLKTGWKSPMQLCREMNITNPGGRVSDLRALGVKIEKKTGFVSRDGRKFCKWRVAK